MFLRAQLHATLSRQKSIIPDNVVKEDDKPQESQRLIQNKNN